MPSTTPPLIHKTKSITVTSKLRVLLVDHQRGRLALMERALLDANYQVVAKLTNGNTLLREVERYDPDIVIIDLESPDRDTLEQMETINRHQPRPIVMFAEDDDQKTIHRAIKAGVSAYIVDGLQSHRVKPVLDVAIARFREYQALRNELLVAKNSLDERKQIERAKGILMFQKEMNEEQAYQCLRRMAMDQGLRIGEIANQIISVVALLNR